ncbi:MAG TPA: radical SAM protein [Syntrophorhabdaceae bacterium]|nr:radical SAM protein [Syntrophorhabdaceae bacterium]
MLIPIFLPHYGCKDRCTYCDQRSITNERPDDPYSHISQVLDRKEGPYEIGLFGGNILGMTHKQLRELFSYFQQYKDKIENFRISTKPVVLDAEKMNIIKKNKVTIIELGCPTFNNTILSTLNRMHTADDTIESFEFLRTEGFSVALQFMAGLPDETMSDIRMTVEKMERLNPLYIRIYPLVVLSGTPMGEMHRRGVFVPSEFETVLDRVVYLYLSALKRGIPVVRMGLSDNELIREHILGGNYHPAYGYLVKSRAVYKAIIATLESFPKVGEEVTVSLNKVDVPHLIGDKRANLRHFLEKGISVQWQIRDIPKNTFVIETQGRCIEGQVLDALNTYAEEARLTSFQP